MHYTGTIWRPPYEAGSLLLEVTAGCTHHRCKFCTLYSELPFKFRMSPLEEVERDLQEAQIWSNDPIGKLTARLQGKSEGEGLRRTFLVGANPFVLKAERLLAVAGLIRQYLPSVQTIGCFARVTDVALKSDGELEALRRAGATFLDGEEAASPREPMTKADLMALGLAGGQNSAARRQALLRRLDLPEHLTANGLLEALNLLYSREELENLLRDGE